MRGARKPLEGPAGSRPFQHKTKHPARPRGGNKHPVKDAQLLAPRPRRHPAQSPCRAQAGHGAGAAGQSPSASRAQQRSCRDPRGTLLAPDTCQRHKRSPKRPRVHVGPPPRPWGAARALSHPGPPREGAGCGEGDVGCWGLTCATPGSPAGWTWSPPGSAEGPAHSALSSSSGTRGLRGDKEVALTG